MLKLPNKLEDIEMDVRQLEAGVRKMREALAAPEKFGIRPEQIKGMKLMLEIRLERLQKARERRATPKGKRRPL